MDTSGSASVEVRHRPRRAKWIVGGALIVAGLSGLAAWAVASPGALSYYKTPTEVAAGRAGPTHDLRVGGRVEALNRDASTVTFRLSDGHHTVPVVYRGDVPDTLKNGTDAVADGTLRADGTLAASQVMAKCSSKFLSDSDAAKQLMRRS